MKKYTLPIAISILIVQAGIGLAAGIANITSDFIDGDLVFQDANTKQAIMTLGATSDTVSVNTLVVTGLVDGVDVSDVRTTVDSLVTSADAMSGDILSLEASANANSGEINSLIVSADAMSGDILSLEASANANSGEINSLIVSADAMSGSINTLLPSANANSGAILSLQVSANANSGAINTLTATKVPYSGAADNVDLGVYGLTAGNLTNNGLIVYTLPAVSFELTASLNGTLTPTATYITVDTFSDEATSNVSNITTANISIGTIIYVQCESDSKDVEFTEIAGAGNLYLGGATRTLTNTSDMIVLMKFGANAWRKIGFYDND